MNRIKDLRLGKNVSMKQVATEIGMPYTTYVNYEKGEREPNSEMLVRLANYFGVTVDYLIGRTDVPEEISQPPAAYCDSAKPNVSHVVLSNEAKKIGAAYDKAAPKDKQMVKYILSDYIDDSDASALPPLQIAASNGAKLALTDDLLDLDLPDGNSRIP